MKSYVVGFLYSPDDESVVLVRKKRPAWQVGKLNGVGGHIEDGETPLKAMEREFKEEAGLFWLGWEEKVVLVHDVWVVHFFLGIDKEGSAIHNVVQMTDEEIEVHPAFDLPQDSIWNLRWLIPLMLDSVGFPIVIRDTGSNGA